MEPICFPLSLDFISFILSDGSSDLAACLPSDVGWLMFEQKLQVFLFVNEQCICQLPLSQSCIEQALSLSTVISQVSAVTFPALDV